MNNGSKIALALLFVSGINLIADTKVGQLTKVFDAAYNRTFPAQKNLLKNELQSPDNLVISVNDVNEYIKNNAKQYVDASNNIAIAMTHIISAVNGIYRGYVKPVNGEVVMLGFTSWKEMLEIANENHNEAQDNLKNATQELKNIVRKKDPELHALVKHMIKSFDDALEKVMNDFQKMRDASKHEKYTRKQAEEVGKKVLDLKELPLSAEDNWQQIMELVGLNYQVTEENKDMAIAKFGNANKDMKLKVSNFIARLYESLPKKK